MARPKLSDKARNTVAIRMRDKELAALDRLCKRRKLKRATLAGNIVLRYLAGELVEKGA